MKKRLSYATGAFIILLMSIGIAAIAYGGGFLVFVPLNLPAWIFIPLGVYSIIFVFINRDIVFYLGLGSILLSIGAASALYNVMNVIVVLGALLVALALIGIFAYLKTS